MLAEEVEHSRFRLAPMWRVGSPSMTGSGEDQKRALHAFLPQRLVQEVGLLLPFHFVIVPMEEQERRSLAGDHAYGGGLFIDLLVTFRGSAQPGGQGPMGHLDLPHADELVGAVVADDGIRSTRVTR